MSKKLGGDLAEFGEKNATQIMIFLLHCMWAENNKTNLSCFQQTIQCLSYDFLDDVERHQESWLRGSSVYT